MEQRIVGTKPVEIPLYGRARAEIASRLRYGPAGTFFFQPVFLANALDEVAGIELLTRFPYKGQLLSTKSTFEYLQKCNLMAEFDLRNFHEACFFSIEANKLFGKTSDTVLVSSLNVTRQFFALEHHTLNINRFIAMGFKPESLMLEVTESDVYNGHFSNFDSHMLKRIHQLSKIGIQTVLSIQSPNVLFHPFINFFSGVKIDARIFLRQATIRERLEKWQAGIRNLANMKAPGTPYKQVAFERVESKDLPSRLLLTDNTIYRSGILANSKAQGYGIFNSLYYAWALTKAGRPSHNQRTSV